MLEGLAYMYMFCSDDPSHLIPMSDNESSIYPVFDFDVANHCDLFVLGGGELINTDRLFIRPFLHWIDQIKVPKVILGCGVNAESYDQLKPHVKEDLEKFSYIGLRDKRSYEILKSIESLKDKVYLFYDPSISLGIKYNLLNDRSDNAVVIPTDRFTNKYDKGIQQFNIVNKSKDWLKEKLKDYNSIKFLAFGHQDNNDLLTCKSLAKEFMNLHIRIIDELSPFEAMQIISKSAMAYPYRLHGLILSLLTGTKYEHYPYHWKLDRVHETFKGKTSTQILIEFMNQWSAFQNLAWNKK